MKEYTDVRPCVTCGLEIAHSTRGKKLAKKHACLHGVVCHTCWGGYSWICKACEGRHNPSMEESIDDLVLKLHAIAHLWRGTTPETHFYSVGFLHHTYSDGSPSEWSVTLSEGGPVMATRSLTMRSAVVHTIERIRQEMRDEMKKLEKRIEKIQRFNMENE